MPNAHKDRTSGPDWIRPVPFAKGGGQAVVPGEGAGKAGDIGIADPPCHHGDRIGPLHQPHGGAVQAHPPHRVCRRFPHHGVVDAVKVKPAKGCDIGQPVQRQVASRVVVDMIHHAPEPSFVGASHGPAPCCPTVMPVAAPANLAELHQVRPKGI